MYHSAKLQITRTKTINFLIAILIKYRFIFEHYIYWRIFTRWTVSNVKLIGKIFQVRRILSNKASFSPYPFWSYSQYHRHQQNSIALYLPFLPLSFLSVLSFLLHLFGWKNFLKVNYL